MSSSGNPIGQNIGQVNLSALNADQQRNTLLGQIATHLSAIAGGGTGTIIYAGRQVSANTTLTSADHTLFVNAAAGAVTVTLPNPTTISTTGTGQAFVIKKTDSTGNAVLLSGYTVDGLNPYSLNFANQSVEIQATTGGYFVL